MSSLNVQFNLKENNSGTPGAIISDPTFEIGDSFFVEILMGDIRPNAFGLTATSLNLNFDADLIQNIDVPFNPTDINSPLITPNFPFGRSGNLNNADGTILNLAGGALPPFFGAPLGVNQLETYSLTKFEAINSGDALINLKIDISQTGFGDGTFADETDITEFSHTITIEGVDTFGPDFNLDGKRDLVWRNQVTGINAVWYMDGATRTGFNYLNSVSDANWQIVGAGDANGDQKTDLYWRNQATGRNVLWYMDGVNRIGSDQLAPVANTDWQIVGIDDADNDSLIDDIYWRNQVTGKNAVWYMDAATRTGSANLPTVANTDWQIVGTGDANGDQNTDIFWRNQATGRNVVWFMDGDTRTGFAELPKVANTDWDIVGTGDANGDQNPDIYWRNQITGINVVWYMDGVNRTGSDQLPSVTNTDWEIVA